MPLRYNELTGMFEEVAANPQINKFSYDGPPLRYIDEIIKFTWEVQDAEKIFINGIEMPAVSTSYEYRLTRSGLQSFVLKIEGGGIEKTESLQIKVLDLPIFNVVQSTKKLRKGKGESLLLKWNIQNAVSFKLRNEEDQLPLVSEKAYTPETTIDYIFEAVGLDGTRTFIHVVHVDVLEEASVQFDIDKALTLPYVPIKLSWYVLHATKIELDGYGEVDYRGEKIIECDRERIFTLRVTDQFGTTEYHQRVALYPLPLIRSILVPTPRIEKNIKVETNFEFKQIQVGIDVKSINLPKYNKINTDVYIPEAKYHQLLVPLTNAWNEKINYYLSTIKQVLCFNKLDLGRQAFKPRASWWVRLNDKKNKLKTSVTDKISNIWNN